MLNALVHLEYIYMLKKLVYYNYSRTDHYVSYNAGVMTDEGHETNV